MTLPPGGSAPVPCQLRGPVSADQVAGIRAGAQAIYLHGRVAYKDIFNKQRVTNFRMFYNDLADPTHGNRLTFYREGNDAT